MNPHKFPRHQFWGVGEPDCPPDIKAPNGELCTMRCKVCGDGWRKSHNVCFGANPAAHVEPVLRADHDELIAALRGLLEIEDDRIANGLFKPNADGMRLIERARAALAAVAGGEAA